MMWSTPQLAHLAGTTVKTIRYYHRRGLLEEPERDANNYKQYQVSHLLRLLQIRRLVDLGMSLDQVASMQHADQDPDDVVRALDAELEATIDRARRARGQLARLLRHQTPVDVPEGFADVGDGLGPADRALATVMPLVLDQEAVRELSELARERRPLDDDFEAVADDADDDTIEALAERLAAQIVANRIGNPALTSIRAHLVPGHHAAMAAVAETMLAVYRPAQIRVLLRAGELADRS